MTVAAWITATRDALEGHGRRPLIEFLQRQRWFGGKGRPLVDVRVLDAVPIPDGEPPRCVALLGVEYRGAERERYAMPLVVRPVKGSGDAQAIAPVPESFAQEWVCDATTDESTWMQLYAAIGQDKQLIGQAGCLIGRALPHGRDEAAAPVRSAAVLSVEQSNTSVVFDRRVILKWIRKLEAGINPESEVLEFLTTRTAAAPIPTLLGLMTYEEGGDETSQPTAVAVAQRFVPNSGNGWTFTLSHLDRISSEARAGFSADAPSTVMEPYLAQIRRLGSVTADLHVALASTSDSEAFRPEPITRDDVEEWRNAMSKQLHGVCHELETVDPPSRSSLGLSLDELAGWRTRGQGCFADLGVLTQGPATKIRHHGDYHLGQVLKTAEGFVIIDFEGEPARSLAERRAKLCPLRDVAGMLRSFDYAVRTHLARQGPGDAAPGWAGDWVSAVRTAFLDGYRATAIPGQASFLPPTWEDSLRVIRAYELDKACYELRYEMRNRPDWLPIPVAGLRAVLAPGKPGRRIEGAAP